MRTTVTLEPDVETLLKRAMRENGLTFKEAVNEAIRAGLSQRSSREYRQRTFSMGIRPEVNYDKALQIAGALEDEELLHKVSLGK